MCYFHMGEVVFFMSRELSPEQRARRREYQRRYMRWYRKEYPQRVQGWQRAYILRKAARLLLEEDEQRGGGDDAGRD